MIINCVGNILPAVLIFPRATLHDSLMSVAPPGSLRLVYSPQSSWVTGPLFLKVFNLEKKHTRSSKEDRIILLMDNHEYHCTFNSTLYARQNGITLSLGVVVMRPFKEKLIVAQHG
jgi:hypothetical protein